MRNYGSAILLRDIVFGSHSNPMRRPEPLVMGIENDTTPRTFWAQVAKPFVRHRS